MKKETISVIIPTYYRHSELPNILNCLEIQTLKPLEIIIVDQTPLKDIPKDFYKNYNVDLPLTVINSNIPSSTRSRNIGAKKARGEFLCFFDDKVLGDKKLIESHLEVMIEENVDVVHGATIHSDIHGVRLPNKPIWEKDIKILDPALIFLISANYQWNGMAIGLNTANMMIRKKAFAKVNGLDENMTGRYDDVDFGYRLFRSGAKIYFSSKPLITNKRIHYGGAYTKKVSILDRLFRPLPHPNYLYFHIKHLPGWSTYQLILKQFFDAYFPSTLWFTNPWILVVTPFRVLRSIYISKKMIHRLKKNT